MDTGELRQQDRAEEMAQTLKARRTTKKCKSTE